MNLPLWCHCQDTPNRPIRVAGAKTRFSIVFRWFIGGNRCLTLLGIPQKKLDEQTEAQSNTLWLRFWGSVIRNIERNSRVIGTLRCMEPPCCADLATTSHGWHGLAPDVSARIGPLYIHASSSKFWFQSWCSVSFCGYGLFEINTWVGMRRAQQLNFYCPKTYD